MSLSVNVEISGDLDNVRNKDLAEHICRLVNETVKKAGDDCGATSVTLGDPWEVESQQRSRPFAGSTPFGDYSPAGHQVRMSSYVHLPDPPAPADAPPA